MRPSSLPGRDIVAPLRAFDEAVTFHNSGRLWEAEQRLEIVLKANRRHFGALYRLGLIRLQQGHFAEAADLFRRSVKVDRRSAEAQLHLGVALAGINRHEEAIRHYENALAIRPVFSEAHNNLGYALQSLGRVDEAVTQYRKALTARPDYAEARNNLGNALQMLKRFEEAIGEYEKALKSRPRDAVAYANLGNALAGLGRHEEAMAWYQKTLAINPSSVHAHHSMGIAFRMCDRLEEAIGEFEKALQIGPDYAEAHLEMGNALSTLGRYEEAISELDKATALKPHYVEALIARGLLLFNMGRDAEGAELLNDLVRAGVDSMDVLVALSTVPAHFNVDLLSELDKIIPAKCEDETLIDKAAFVRAAALDKLGRQAEAWECLTIVNRRIFATLQADVETEVTRQRITLGRLRAKPKANFAYGTERDCTTSVFILGPSRSGKTTLERLLSTLPDVKCGYESSCAIDEAVRRTLEAHELPIETKFEDIPRTLHAFCQQAYTDHIFERSEFNTIVTSTLPGRVYTADLMIDVFPHIRYLCVKRDVEDTTLRIYQRFYKQGNGYAYDLRTARDYVLWYHQAMDLLCEKFPHAVHVISYEEMVTYPGGILRSAAKFCGARMTGTPRPLIGDDRGCAAPYSRLMAEELTC